MRKYEELKVKLRDWRLSLPSDNKEAMLLAANAIESLERQLETERMRLVACGVVAMSNTPDSAAKALEMLPEYRSASCDGVARAVDREMGLREQLATVIAQRDLLGKILSCQVKLNESEACLVYQDCYEAIASLKGE